MAVFGHYLSFDPRHRWRFVRSQWREAREKETHVEPAALEKVALEKINEEYLKSVKPIFQTSCMNCHGAAASLPWYNALPGVKQLITYDTTESKEHLDMSKDFPFGGHGDSPTEDLDAIQEALTKGTMPPLRYRVMHWSSAVSGEDLKAVITWIQNSKQELEQIKTKTKGHDL